MPPKKIPAKGVKGKIKAEAKAVAKGAKASKSAGKSKDFCPSLSQARRWSPRPIRRSSQ